MSTDDIELRPETRESLEQHDLRPLWEIAENDMGQRRENLTANLWKWDEIREAVDHVEVDIPDDASPRVTVPVNPSYGAAVSHTMSVGIEAVPPGNITETHRHSGHFLRFAIDANREMKSTVGGETFPMEDHDLLTIPQWEWHGHHNESEEEAVWLVIDDTPLRIDALNIGAQYESDDDDTSLPDRPRGYHRALFGNCRAQTGNAEKPGPFEGVRTPTPPYCFDWSDMSRALDYAAKDGVSPSPYDGIAVEYTNPSGRIDSVFPTLGVRAQRLVDGERTDTHKHNATEVFFVIEGSGETIVEGEPLDWSGRDIFVVPTYKAHSHVPDGSATILAITDRPLLEAINCYHETADEL